MMTNPLIRKLRLATTVCDECGAKYGTARGGCATYYEGVCEVCNTEKVVTESRDWCYLARGVKELQQQQKGNNND